MALKTHTRLNAYRALPDTALQNDHTLLTPHGFEYALEVILEAHVRVPVFDLRVQKATRIPHVDQVHTRF